MKILPPHNTSPEPDKETAKAILSDYAGSRPAENRILHINLILLKYGTDDKVHAAAIFLSFVLLVVIIILIFLEFFCGTPENLLWADKTFSWLTGTFLFVSGVALGKGSSPEGNGKTSDREY